MKVMLLDGLITGTGTVSSHFLNLGFVYPGVDDLTDEKKVAMAAFAPNRTEIPFWFPIHFHCDLPGTGCSGC